MIKDEILNQLLNHISTIGYWKKSIEIFNPLIDKLKVRQKMKPDGKINKCQHVPIYGMDIIHT